MIVTDFSEDDHPPALPTARMLERFITTAAAAIPLRGEVSVLLTSDRGVRRLNREYRKKNKPTDVLSFPAAGPVGRGKARVAGDLAISVDMAARQALALDHPLSTELKVLILHGMLHLAGFDHEADKGEMAARELVLRRKLRLPGGLIERTEAGVPETSPRRAPATRKKSSRKVARA
jgi:probable rRNA maturation factor